jgi:DNA-binding HxlR family transcriptional regulator
MKGDNEMIQTLRPDGRKGEFLPRGKYDKWSLFILSALDTEKDLTLNDLLEQAHQKVSGATDHEIGWYVLHVKRDLEARRLIKVTAAPVQKHTFFMKLTRLGLTKLQYEIQLAEWSETKP